ncbi:MAG TPA: formate/nitrite transporter family protein [Solirubrobacterales bacterium]|nr:formate/nitrite transporter family protein [Solirubrobacterales bacterium]
MSTTPDGMLPDPDPVAPAVSVPPAERPAGLDALMPPEIASKATDVGVTKASMSFPRTFSLAVLAGAFIALGAMFATTVVAGADGEMPFGVTRLLAGLVFCLGLILVVVAGAELFTGNNLIVMAWADRRIPIAWMLRNWVVVYAGNLIGALGTVAIVFVGAQYEFGDGGVGSAALTIAQAKTSLGWGQAVALGVMCNALVCLAIWLTYSARSVTDKVLAVIFPITAFVAAGFEHSVANMYFLAMGVLVKEAGSDGFFAEIGKSPADFPDVTWIGAAVDNLVPVTIGNIIGGSLMVGVVYWLVYVRTTS